MQGGFFAKMSPEANSLVSASPKLVGNGCSRGSYPLFVCGVADCISQKVKRSDSLTRRKTKKLFKPLLTNRAKRSII